MTETQIDHRAPLAPGEIRTHTVGAQRFTVMHVAGGSFTQASVWPMGGPTHVLCTDMDTAKAVRAYADAIDALDEGGLCFTPSGAFIDGGAAQQERDDAHAEALAGLGTAPTVREQDGTPDAEAMDPGMPSDRQRHVLDHRERRIWTDAERKNVDGMFYSCLWTDDHRRGETNAEHWHKLGDQEPPAPLAELLDAYGEAMAKGGMYVAMGNHPTAAKIKAERADALKAEILGRFGGER